MTTVTTTPGIHLRPGGQPHLTAGSWRVGAEDSHASFAARLAGRRVRGRLPLAGQVLIAEPIEESRVRLTASAPDAARPGGAPRLVIACSWAVDATWVTSQRIPALGRRIAMTCSFHLDPDMSPTRHIAV